MKVWLDWDSAPFECMWDKPLSGKVSVEIHQSDWRDYQETLERYERWQERLHRMRTMAETERAIVEKKES
jgi:hypothetical protein